MAASRNDRRASRRDRVTTNIRALCGRRLGRRRAASPSERRDRSYPKLAGYTHRGVVQGLIETAGCSVAGTGARRNVAGLIALNQAAG